MQMNMGKAVMIVMMDVEPEWEDKYNHWYNDVHLPERHTLDGYVSARRYKISEGDLPKYLCIWELEDLSVLQSKEYLEQRASVPDWVNEIRAHIKTSLRGVYTQIYPLEGAFEDRSGPKTPD